MGIWDSFTDLVEAATPWSTVEAEAAQGDSSADSTSAQPEDGEGEAKVRIYLFFEFLEVREVN